MAKLEFGERLQDLAVRIIKLAQTLPKDLVGKHIAGQVLRSGTSAGANYCEAQGAESRADFAHKMQLVVKELRETLFWIETSRRAQLVKGGRLRPLVEEVNELIAIGVKSVTTAKANARRNRKTTK